LKYRASIIIFTFSLSSVAHWADEALFTATWGKDLGLLNNALKAGGNPNAGLKGSESTPLHSAAAMGLTDFINRLLEGGANINAGPDFILSPLTEAISSTYVNHDDTRVVSHLLDRGASLDKQGPNCNLPLHFAVERGRTAAARLLISRYPDEQTLARDLARKNRSGQTILHLVKDPSLAALLLEHGANPNEVDNDGNTPLLTKLADHNWEVARVLLKQHSAVNLPNAFGETPLFLAVTQAHAGSGALVRELVENGANPFLPDACALKKAAYYRGDAAHAAIGELNRLRPDFADVGCTVYSDIWNSRGAHSWQGPRD